MKWYLLGLPLVISAGIGWIMLPGASPTQADEGRAIVYSAAVIASAAGDEQEYEYVGSKKCKMCHIKLYKSWEATKMGRALDTLKPGHATESKEKFNLDASKDYTQDEACLKCHTTGLGHAGGYSIPDPGDKKAVRRAKKLANVGCESCHGPGSEYIKVFKDIFMSKRKYKVEELHAAGLWKIDESTCTTCHNSEGPTFDASVPFDFAKRKDEGIHAHAELKHREE